jgi:hypothetical protein
MVDTLDLKSNGHYGCGGSSPPPGTIYGKYQGLGKYRLPVMAGFPDQVNTLNVERCWGFFLRSNLTG